MMPFILKSAVAGILIAFASKIAPRNPVLAGFIIALPLMSMLSILFTYFETKDMEKINQFAVSILLAVPLSLTFFIPFILNKWLKLNFGLTYALALLCLTVAYTLHHFIFKIAGAR